MYQIQKAILIVVPALTMCLGANGQSLSSQDKKFIETAAKGGEMEVRMGKLGVANGSSDSVKTFSQMIVDDHSKANEELKGLAAKKSVTLPTDSGPQAPERTLAKKSGGAFDKAYADAMVTDHQKDIQEFEKEASSGSDPDVKKWASDTLPTLKAHLEKAKSLNSKSGM